MELPYLLTFGVTFGPLDTRVKSRRLTEGRSMEGRDPESKRETTRSSTDFWGNQGGTLGQRDWS